MTFVQVFLALALAKAFEYDLRNLGSRLKYEYRTHTKRFRKPIIY